MKEYDKTIRSVEAYKTPAFNGKSLLKSILTLGFSKPKHLSEPALLYRFERGAGDDILLYTETMAGQREDVALLQATQDRFRQLVLEKKSFKYDGYVYHFDADTIVYDKH